MDWYVYGKGSSPIRAITRRRRFRLKGPLTIGLAVLVLLGLLWSGYALWTIDRAKSTSPMQKADVGIVLGMSMWGDEPSPGLKERLDYGLKLYKEGLFPRFIVSGGLDRPEYKYTEAEGMHRYLLKAGVPDKDILLENAATSTYQNLLFSKEIMKREGMNSSIIITHTYHGRRSLEIAQALGYHQPELGLTESRVMSMAWNKSREVLAYTKWKLQELFL